VLNALFGKETKTIVVFIDCACTLCLWTPHSIYLLPEYGDHQLRIYLYEGPILSYKV